MVDPAPPRPLPDCVAVRDPAHLLLAPHLRTMPTISQGRITDPAPLPPTLCLSHGRRSPSTNAASADHGHLHLGPRQQIADPAPLPRPLSQSWMLLTFPSAASADRDHHPPRAAATDRGTCPPSSKSSDHRPPCSHSPRAADRGPCSPPLPCVAVTDPALLLPVLHPRTVVTFPRGRGKRLRRPRTTADNRCNPPQHGSLTPEPTVTGKALQLRPDITTPHPNESV